MNNQLEIYNLRSDLSSSETFGSHYEEVFANIGSTFENPLHKDVEDMYNNIIGGDYYLSHFQQSVLQKIFNEFNSIKFKIDPKRLKSFEYFVNDENELILWRKDEEKLINLTVYESEDIALSCITNDENTSLLFFNLESDFELITLKFLA